jgi:hypothetical protein
MVRGDCDRTSIRFSKCCALLAQDRVIQCNQSWKETVIMSKLIGLWGVHGIHNTLLLKGKSID